MTDAPASHPTAGMVARGIGLFTLAVFLLAVMDVLIKWLSDGNAVTYPTGQIVFFRAVFGLIPVLWLIRRAGPQVLATRHPGQHIVRGLFGAGAAFSFFWAFGQMPLADAYAIAFTAPLFMTALSVPLLGERVGLRRWMAVAVGFVGVLVMLQPDAEAAGFLSWGAVAAFAGAFCYATHGILIRRMARTDTNEAIILYGALVIATLSAATLPFAFIWPRPIDFLMLAATGLVGGFGVLCLTQAFRLAAPAILAPFEYTAMIWGVLFGITIWGDIPSLWVLLGASIVAASGLYILHRETRNRSAAVSPDLDADTGRAPDPRLSP